VSTSPRGGRQRLTGACGAVGRQDVVVTWRRPLTPSSARRRRWRPQM